jgi:predicted enzyme related to lactoylglutathione lyase
MAGLCIGGRCRRRYQETKSLGAKIMLDVTEVPNAGTMSVIIDPTGAELALWKSKNG